MVIRATAKKSFQGGVAVLVIGRQRGDARWNMNQIADFQRCAVDVVHGYLPRSSAAIEKPKETPITIPMNSSMSLSYLRKYKRNRNG